MKLIFLIKSQFKVTSKIRQIINWR